MNFIIVVFYLLGDLTLPYLRDGHAVPPAQH